MVHGLRRHKGLRPCPPHPHRRHVTMLHPHHWTPQNGLGGIPRVNSWCHHTRLLQTSMHPQCGDEDGHTPATCHHSVNLMFQARTQIQSMMWTSKVGLPKEALAAAGPAYSKDAARQQLCIRRKAVVTVWPTSIHQPHWAHRENRSEPGDGNTTFQEIRVVDKKKAGQSLPNTQGRNF